MTLKQCPKCKQYWKRYRKENKEKIAQYQEKYYQDNKEKANMRSKKYRQENKEKIKVWRREYRQENKEKIKAEQKKYYQDNKEKLKAQNKKYYQDNKEKAAQYQKKYRKENKEYLVPKQNKWRRKRRITNSTYRLNCLMKSAIRKSLKNGHSKQGRHWETLVPYNAIQLEKHLKKTLPKGYTWQDFMQGKLHIDHIIPKSAFYFTKPEDMGFQICWALDNVRLLPALENINKRAKLLAPFQKTFAIQVQLCKKGERINK